MHHFGEIHGVPVGLHKTYMVTLMRLLFMFYRPGDHCAANRQMSSRRINTAVLFMPVNTWLHDLCCYALEHMPYIQQHTNGRTVVSDQGTLGVVLQLGSVQDGAKCMLRAESLINTRVHYHHEQIISTRPQDECYKP